MTVPGFLSAALYENKFWLQVLGDHSRFIYRSLSPSEQQEIKRAEVLIAEFDQLLAHARTAANEERVAELHNQAYHCVKKLKNFKLHLLHRHLVGEIGMNMSPTFLSHMVNELEEYERILRSLQTGKVPSFTHPIHHHLLWLLDAVGHAASIKSSLDMAEKDLSKESRMFLLLFEDYHYKALEFAGYLRTKLDVFPALTRLNQQVEQNMRLFMNFLQRLSDILQDGKLLGTISPLILDHMLREECYYLNALVQITDTDAPNCDPTAPRITEKP